MTDEDRKVDGPQPEGLALFERGVVDLIETRELAERLRKKGSLRVKFGMDPSAPDLHLGHAVQLFKLRALQQAGHTIVLIVGDSTAMVGDPTGRNKLRPQLTREAVEANLVTYTEQAGAILDLERTEVRRNSEWFDAMAFHDVLALASKMTVAQMIERDTFDRRMKAREPIGIHEFIYPLMQGWDSVQIDCDAELGGTDQLFNLLVGRDLQRAEGGAGQVCFTMPLINGLDGRKMSKSYGNAVGLTDPPAEMFGKVMSIADDVMESWFTLLTEVDPAEIAALLTGHPREAKVRLASEITAFFHGAGAAEDALEGFNRQFRDKQLPDDIPEVAFGGEWPAEGLPLSILLRETKLAASSSEARRLVNQGAVKVAGEVLREPMAPIPRPAQPLLLQVGKRRFARVRAD